VPTRATPAGKSPAGKSIATPSFQYCTVRAVAGSRRFKLYVPTGYQGQQPLPLIVMLHGCTQSPDDFAAGTGMNELAEAHTFLVAYPEQPKSANPNKCWNWFNEGDQGRDYGEPLLIAELTRQIARDYAVDRESIYVAGMSGGAAAAIMAATYPDLYAAVGIHSGLAYGAARDIRSAFSAMRQGAPAAHRLVRNERIVPTIVFHGDRDTTVSPVNGDQVSEQASGEPGVRTRVSRGTTPTGIAFTRTTRYDGKDRSIGEQWVLQGIGHAWSGGSAKESFTDARGPDASAEFVRFFLQHRLTA
jgi:poly(hydroxyalkanoate) depolymerase family esterase